MAEIFGAVASGAGLISLSMQLLESTQKLKGFYNASRDAPDTVARLCFDLETMSLALRQFEQYRQSGIVGDELLGRCISTCGNAVAVIKTAVDKVGRLLHRSRVVGRLYMGFKEPEVKRLLGEAEQAKSSLFLAYMSYCQSWNMRETAKHAAALHKQHSMSSSHSRELNDVQNTVNASYAAIDRHLTSLSVDRALEDKTAAELRNAALPIFLARQNRVQRAYRARVSLPCWLVDCVWEFGLYKADGVWTVQLCPISVRTSDSYVYDVVCAGNWKTVRRLLDSGHMSIRDHFLGFRPISLLDVASRKGDVELCEWLLQKTSFFQEDEILLAFEAVLRYAAMRLGMHGYQDLLDAAHNLFVLKLGLDVNIPANRPGVASAQPLLLRSLPHSAIHEHKLAKQSRPFRELPFARRFSLVVQSEHWPPSVLGSFLSDRSVVEVSTSADENGKTALHWAAMHFGKYLRSWFSQTTRSSPKLYDYTTLAYRYATVAVHLIRSGADVHAVFRDQGPFSHALSGEIDPFIGFLKGFDMDLPPDWDSETLSMLVEKWGCLILDAGLSLREYAATESGFISNTRPVLRQCRYWPEPEFHVFDIRPLELVVLNKCTLAIRVRNHIKIGLREARAVAPPGAWLEPSERADLIIWEPDQEDISEGLEWVVTSTIKLQTDPYLVQPTELDSTSDPSRIAREGQDARTDLLTDTQDDHGPVAMLIYRELIFFQRPGRRHSRRRAASSHAAERPLHDFLSHRDAFIQSRLCVNGVHKCPFDGRWSSSSSRCKWRVCMRGDCHLWTMDDYPWNWLNTWEAWLLKDQDHMELASRFAHRFHPAGADELKMVERTAKRAKEKAELSIVLAGEI